MPSSAASQSARASISRHKRTETSRAITRCSSSTPMASGSRSPAAQTRRSGSAPATPALAPAGERFAVFRALPAAPGFLTKVFGMPGIGTASGSACVRRLGSGLGERGAGALDLRGGAGRLQLGRVGAPCSPLAVGAEGRPVASRPCRVLRRVTPPRGSLMRAYSQGRARCRRGAAAKETAAIPGGNRRRCRVTWLLAGGA